MQQIIDTSFFYLFFIPPALKRVRTRRRSLSNLLRPLMKWSPYLKIVIPGPSIYQRVRSLSTTHKIMIKTCVALTEVELTLPFCWIPSVTTLRQRLLQPDFQPAGASQLHPRHKHLLMKRSLRCRVSITSGFHFSSSNTRLLLLRRSHSYNIISLHFPPPEMWAQSEQARV